MQTLTARLSQHRIVALLGLACAGVLTPLATQAQVAAKAADSFVESIGVNTHWEYPSYANYAGLKTLLVESGIRYVRDGSSPNIRSKVNELYTSHGIRTNVILGRRFPGGWPQPLDLSQISTELGDIKVLTAGAVASLEAPNEYDISHGGGETDWVTKIQAYSRNAHAGAKADAALRNLPILGPSLTSGDAYSRVGNMDAWIDYANIHPYQSDRHPGTGGWGDNGYGSLDWVYRFLVAPQTPAGKPVQATECGYHNDFAEDGLSEEAEGKYTARMYAEFFRKGIARSFKYELLNQGSGSKEDVFGLVRNDLTPKPAFRAVKNLIAVLSDPGAAFVPSTLTYTLTGSTNNVRQLLLQKRNGDFYLLLWLEVPSWDVNTSVNLYPAAQNVSLTLPTTIAQATLYTLDNAANPSTTAATITNRTLAVSVTDKVTIVKLARGGALAAAASAASADLSVYPNPAQAYLHVELATPGAAVAIVTDALSRPVLTQPLGPDGQLRLGQLPGGLYLLTVKQGSRRWHKRFLVNP